jgi:hypothetical protein
MKMKFKRRIRFVIVSCWGFISFALICDDPLVGIPSLGLCLLYARDLDRKDELPKIDDDEPFE